MRRAAHRNGSSSETHMTVSAKDPRKTKTSYMEGAPDRCTFLNFAIQSGGWVGHGRPPVLLAPGCRLRVVRVWQAARRRRGERNRITSPEFRGLGWRETNASAAGPRSPSRVAAMRAPASSSRAAQTSEREGPGQAVLPHTASRAPGTRREHAPQPPRHPCTVRLPGAPELYKSLPTREPHRHGSIHLSSALSLEFSSSQRTLLSETIRAK